MNQKYIELFREIAHNTEIMAERVMEYDKQKDDKEGLKTAETMRNDFSNLYDKIRADNFKPETLTRAEWAKILVGSMIVTNNIEQQLENQRKALQGYKMDLIPKLNRIMEETKTDEEATKLAENLFEISEDK